MDYLSTVTITDVIVWTVIGIGTYFYTVRQITKHKLVPKYRPGQCIVFEQRGEKKTGVILRSEVVESEACNHSSTYAKSLNYYHNQRIRYKVDIKHVKYNESIHRYEGPFKINTPDGKVIEMGSNDTEIVWIDEKDVGCNVPQE